MNGAHMRPILFLYFHMEVVMPITRYTIQECLERTIMMDETKCLVSSSWTFRSHGGFIFQINYINTEKHDSPEVYIRVNYYSNPNGQRTITAFYDDFDFPVIVMHRGCVLYYANRLKNYKDKFYGQPFYSYDFKIFQRLFKFIQDEMNMKGFMLLQDSDIITVDKDIDKEEHDENRNI